MEPGDLAGIVRRRNSAKGQRRSDEQPVLVVLLRDSRGAAADRYLIVEDTSRSFDLKTFDPSAPPAGN